eukprot:768440-Hanusia_phi.AAC.4
MARSLKGRGREVKIDWKYRGTATMWVKQFHESRGSMTNSRVGKGFRGWGGFGEEGGRRRGRGAEKDERKGIEEGFNRDKELI